MNERKQPAPHEVDALVRSYLERQAGNVDAKGMLDRVRREMEGRAARGDSPGSLPFVQPSAEAPRRSRGRGWVWKLAVAAAVVLAVLGTLQLEPGKASARTLLIEAQQVHHDSVDRCYRLEMEPDPAMRERFPMLEPKQDVLWTRGDRFWIEATLAEKKWAWGRDEKDRIWLAPSPSRGVRFDADEVPEALAVACNVRSVRMETLLKEVLQDFDLKEEKVERGSEVHRIRAELKPGRENSTLKSALIEIDSKTKVIRRLVLSRTLGGENLGQVTLVLIETRQQPDDAYQLEGHLNPYAPIYTRTQPALRLKVLVDHLGSIAHKLVTNRLERG